jgi:hypothetical protein
MPKVEQRAVDEGIVQLAALDEAGTIEWWKKRFGLIAAVPTEIARAGALLPQMRQLSRLAETDRRRLTKARMQAFLSLPTDQRQRISAAKKLALASDPELVKSDDALVERLIPEIPGAQEAAREMGA